MIAVKNRHLIPRGTDTAAAAQDSGEAIRAVPVQDVMTEGKAFFQIRLHAVLRIASINANRPTSSLRRPRRFGPHAPLQVSRFDCTQPILEPPHLR